jgi:O-antigen/teichoic acid export membrane protein
MTAPQAAHVRVPSVSRNMAANLLGQLWIALMMIAFVPVFIRHLGLEAYGLIGLFMTLQAVMTLFDAGMSPTLNREMARFRSGGIGTDDARDLLKSIETLSIGLALLIAVAMVAGAGKAAASWLDVSTLDTGTVRFALVAMGIAMAARFVEALYRSALMGLEMQVWFNAANALVNTSRHGGAAVIVAFVAPDIIAFFAWYLVTTIASVLLFRTRLMQALPGGSRPGRFSLDALKPIYRFALGMLGINLLTILLTQVDKLLLSRLLPLADFGIYMLAFTAASALGIFGAAITQAFLPVMVGHISRSDPRALSRSYHLGAQLVGVTVIPAGLALVLWPHDVLLLWSGDPELAGKAAGLVSLLAAGMMINALMMQPYFAMVAHGWTRLAMISNLTAVVILLPAIMLTVPRAGAEAAAWIWICLNAGYVLMQIPLMHRRILKGEMRSWYLRDVGLPAVVAFGTGLILTALRPMLELTRPGLVLSLSLSWALMMIAMLAASSEIRSSYGPMLARRRP